MLVPQNFCLLRCQNHSKPLLEQGFLRWVEGRSHPCLSPFSRLCQGLPGLHGGRARPL